MRREICAIVLLLATACGGTPSTPSMPLPFSGRLALGDGRRFLSIVGDSVRCGDVQTQVGTSVAVDVMGSIDGTGWTLRQLDDTGGSFEIHVERMLSTGTLGSVPLTGSARGYAIDSSRELLMTPTGTTLTFTTPGGAPLTVTGRMPFGSLATGEFQGPVTFSRGGVTASCPAGAVTWSLTNSSPQ
jgi:hypothetical protein